LSIGKTAIFCYSFDVKDYKKAYSEPELVELTQKVRKAAGKTQKEVAYDLGVSQASISQAEASPERSLLELRKRIIEKYSDYKLVGPEFRLVKKK
jgi:DNA-binding XRE family transcriptional regulator